ncbi:MAG: hypothetical protein ACRDIY_20855, partial [Chloroflexota bacterium]
GSTATQDQITAAGLAVDQAKNTLSAAQAQRDGICGNAQNPQFQCDAANAQVAATEVGIQQAQLGLNALQSAATPDQEAARLDQALTSTQARLDRLHALLPDYERLTLDVGFASGAVTQSIGKGTDLALQPNPTTLQAQSDAAQTRLNQAQSDLAAFEKANGIGDLTTELASQQALVNDLNREVLGAQVSAAGQDQAIATEQTELNRLAGLQPTYDQLNAQVGMVQAQLTQLQSSRLSLLLNDNLSPSAEVKVLDQPRLQPNTLWTIVLYAMSTIFGACAGLVVVYLIAYFDQTPRSLDDVEALVNAPVLVRLPRAG